jgi:hypothetical protein
VIVANAAIAAAIIPAIVHPATIVRFINPVDAVPISYLLLNATHQKPIVRRKPNPNSVLVAKKSNRKKNKDNAAMLARMVNTYLSI